jgi:hypothetical protein
VGTSDVHGDCDRNSNPERYTQQDAETVVSVKYQEVVNLLQINSISWWVKIHTYF